MANSSNHLEWKTACTEKAFFVLQRSEDGVQFVDLTTIQSVAPECNQPFHYADQQPLQGKSYYRLLITDEKGVVTISKIILLQRSGHNQMQIKLSPNPVQDAMARFSIQSTLHEQLSVTIFDVAGRAIIQTNMEINKGIQVREINLQQVVPGIYTAVFFTKEGKVPVRFLRK